MNEVSEISSLTMFNLGKGETIPTSHLKNFENSCVNISLGEDGKEKGRIIDPFRAAEWLLLNWRLQPVAINHKEHYFIHWNGRCWEELYIKTIYKYVSYLFSIHLSKNLESTVKKTIEYLGANPIKQGQINQNLRGIYLANAHLYWDETACTFKKSSKAERMQYYNTNYIDITPKKMPIPKWNAYLDDLRVPGDDPDEKVDLIKVIQELFGYSLHWGLNYQVFFTIKAKKASGKTTMLRILNLIHHNSTFNIDLDKITNQYATSGLVGRRLAFGEEITHVSQTGGEMLKMITGGSPIRCEAKYKDACSILLDCVPIIFCNEFPSFVGSDEALYSRIVLMSMDTLSKPKGTIDEIILDLKEELPGILAWAMKGLTRLLKQVDMNRNDRFSMSNDMIAELKDLQLDNDMYQIWFNSAIILCDATTQTKYHKKDEFWNSFRNWFEHRRPSWNCPTDQTFYKNFNRLLSAMGITTQLLTDKSKDKRIWTYAGLKINHNYNLV